MIVCGNCQTLLAQQPPAVDDDLVPQTPRMQELLHSNEQPSDNDEYSSLREMRSVHQKRLDILDREIAQIQAVLENSKHIRSQVADTLKRYDGMLHPLRGLPEDVLCEIFLASVETDCWNDPVRGKTLRTVTSFSSQVQSLGAVTQVCKRWRHISLGFPKLWTTIQLNLDTIPRTNGPDHLLELHLDRSSSCLLTVCLTWSNEQAKHSPFLPPLLANSKRWKTLVVSGPRNHFNTILGPIRGVLPSLQNLRIKTNTRALVTDDQQQTPDMIDCFELAPNLRHLRTSSQIAEFFLLPFSTISIWITPYSTPFSLSTFIEMVNLQQCDIRISSTLSTNAQQPGRNSDVTVLPQLKNMSLKTSGVADISHIIDQITLPSLEELKLCGTCEPISSIPSLLQRSQFQSQTTGSSTSATLQRLVLFPHISLDEPTLTTILTTSPNLRFFQLQISNCFTDSLIRRLTLPCSEEGAVSPQPQTQAQTLAPHLEVLILFGTLPCKLPSFVKMISSRSGVLTDVNMESAHEFGEDEMETLKACSAEGLTFFNGDAVVGEDEEDEGEEA